MFEQYSLSLAVENLLPLAFVTIGLVFLTRMLNRKNELVGELSYVSAFLLIAGNLLNAIGKLLNALYGYHAPWMKNSLLFLAAPGFVCLAWALRRANLKELTAGKIWLLPICFNGALLALTAAVKMVKGGQAWLKLLLAVITVASFAAFVQLALQALRHQKQLIAGLFILSLGMSLALVFRGNDGSEAAEWAQQISNTISHALFAFAAISLDRIEALRP
mgnify:CR=1 FL=1